MLLKQNIHFRWGLLALFLVVLTSCGGGGGGGTKASSQNTTSSNSSSSVAAPVATGSIDSEVVIVSEQVVDKITPVLDDSGEINALEITDKEIADKAKPDAILFLPPTQSVPNGIAIKVISSVSTPTGVSITFTQPQINEVFDNLEIRLRKDITAENVTSAVLPSGVKLTSQADLIHQLGIKVLPNGVSGLSLEFNPKGDLPSFLANGEWTDILTGEEFRRGGNFSLGDSIGFKFDDLVLADQDGKYLIDDGARGRGPDGRYIAVSEVTTNDQIRLNGEVALKHAAVDFDLKIQDRQVMKFGARMNGTLDTNITIGYQWAGRASLTDATGELKNGFTVGKGFKVEGVDFGAERIMLGHVGVGLIVVTPTVSAGASNKIPPLTIGAILSLSMGLEGDITADVSMGFDYDAYFDNGVYLGRNNTSEPLKTLAQYNIFSDGDYPNPNSANARPATQKDVDKKPFFALGFDGSVSHKGTFRIGVDLSIVVAGMIPAQVTAPLIFEQSSEVNGSAWRRSAGWDLIGCYKHSFLAELKPAVFARLYGSVDGPWGIDGELEIVDKKIELITLILDREPGAQLTCSVQLESDITYDINPDDLPKPTGTQAIVRFSGDAKWKALNSLSNSGDAEIETWEWAFGESTKKDVANALSRDDDQYPVYTYNKPGSYTVTLKVKDAYGQEETIEKTVIIGCSDVTDLTNSACNSLDSDNDGMPDEWEILYGLVVGQDDSLLDLDGDGISNIDEFKNGTDPTKNDTSISAIEPEMVPIPGTTYSMSKYETTFAQYDAYVNETGAEKPSDEGWGRGNRPVINVSWDDAVAYAAWLSQKTGKKYRLPTKDEWEFSARAGTTTGYSWGDYIGVNNANCNGCGSQWDGIQTASVGSFQPNSFGLFDMHGNVLEWSSSVFCRDLVEVEWCGDRTLHGGFWGGSPETLRSAVRIGNQPFARGNFFGFRLVQDNSPPTAAVEPEMVSIPGTTYAMSKYETTFDQYDAYVNETGAEKPSDEGWGRGTRPVINVSWDDAVAYAEWLSQKTGKSYRLPTEEEWEFSARAGTTTNYSWGDDIDVNNPNCNGCGSQWDGVSTAPVGSFQSNGFGLFDMHGNVLEWTSSCWSVNECGSRVFRGGSWGYNPNYLRSAYRLNFGPSYRDNNIGFRLVQELIGGPDDGCTSNPNNSVDEKSSGRNKLSALDVSDGNGDSFIPTDGTCDNQF